MSNTLTSLFDELYDASFRGVEFHIPSDSAESGRRVQRWLFPGRDGAIHQDLGGLAGQFEVTGLIVGDDYIRRAKALEAAFNAPGPGTLVHPWRGEIEAVLVEPCRITLDERQIRVATFRAVFERWIEQPAAARDTLGELLGQFDALRAQVRSYLRRALAPVRMALAAIAAVRSVIGSVLGAVSTVTGIVAGAGGTFRALLADPLAELSLLLGVPASLYTPDRIFAAAAAPAAAVSGAATRPNLPMIAPGGGSSAPDQLLGPRVAAQALLGLAAGLSPSSIAVAPGTPAAAVLLAARALTVIEAASCVVAIDFASSQDAEIWRARLDVALAETLAAAATEAAADPIGAAPVWRALASLRVAVAADLTAVIGRLPSVSRIVAPPATVPAWVIAYHLAGDAPGDVPALVGDLVARNGLAHPSVVTGGLVLEWLPA